MSLWSELSRRKVVKVAAVYAVTAWLLVQVIVTIEEPLGLPGWVDTLVIVLLAIGFPVALVLSWAFDVTPEGIRHTTASHRASPSGGSLFGYVSQGLVLLAVAFLVVNEFVLDNEPSRSTVAPAADVLRYRYIFPEGQRISPQWGINIAVSHDGSSLLYLGDDGNGQLQLWRRDRNALGAVAVPGSRNAIQPFFAPDGPGFGFVTADREIKVVTGAGQEPLVLADGVYRTGAAWADDGNVYFVGQAGIGRVAATGASPPEPVADVTPTDPAVPVYAAWPDALPGSTGVVFTIVRDHLPNFIAVADTRTGEVRRLMEGQVARYANSGHLLHVRIDGALMATPFDVDSLDVSGEAVPLGAYLPQDEAADIALSKNGRLIYAARTEMTLEAVWVDREGNWTPVDPDRPIRQSRYVNLSPDNQWLAVSENLSPESSNDDGQILLKQLPRGPLAPLTFTDGVNMRPAWTPDGEAIAFVSDRGGERQIWVKKVQQTAAAELLLSDSTAIDEIVFSRDGEWLVYRRGKEDGQRDILARRVNADSEPRALAATEFNETSPALSPDGHWLAYVSDRGGEWNVYVTPFPEGGKELRVSVDGGRQPLWAPDRPELYFVNGAGYLVAAEFAPGATFVPGEEQILFPAGAYLVDRFHPAFDITSDGERFVMIRISDSGTVEEDLIVVENFFEEIVGATTSR